MLAWTLVPGGADSPAPGVASSEIAGSTCLVCVRVTARYGAAFFEPVDALYVRGHFDSRCRVPAFLAEMVSALQVAPSPNGYYYKLKPIQLAGLSMRSR
jgi:hypothetical protein